MIVYLVALLLSVAFCFASLKVKRKWLKYVLMILSALPFFLVSALRYNVGTDAKNFYSPFFERASLMDFSDAFGYLSDRYEVGFSFIATILSRISDSPTILFTFCAAIFTGFTYAAIYQQSKKPILGIIIFFISGAFFFSLNLVRIYVALSIAIYSLKFIVNKKPIRYIVCIVIAVFFHKSLLILLPLYFIPKIKLSPKKILGFITLSIPLAFVIDKIMAALLNGTSYGDYFNSAASFADPTIAMLVINSILLLGFFFNYKKNQKDPFYMLSLGTQMIAVIFSLFSFRLPQANRVEDIFNFFQIVTVPYNIYLMWRGNTKLSKNYLLLIFASTIMAAYTVYFINLFIESNHSEVIPYVDVITKTEWGE